MSSGINNALNSAGGIISGSTAISVGNVVVNVVNMQRLASTPPPTTVNTSTTSNVSTPNKVTTTGVSNKGTPTSTNVKSNGSTSYSNQNIKTNTVNKNNETNAPKSTTPQSNTNVNTGRGKNHLKPDEMATGDHTVVQRDAKTGKIIKYETYEVNAKNPSGFQTTKSYHGVGDADYNKVTGENVPTPHIHDKTIPGNVSAAEDWEIPK